MATANRSNCAVITCILEVLHYVVALFRVPSALYWNVTPTLWQLQVGVTAVALQVFLRYCAVAFYNAIPAQRGPRV